jgi:DUF4097 and DUF4098 domain-containing protein YvlB
MRKKYCVILALGFCLALAVDGCKNLVCDWSGAKYQRIVLCQAPLEADSTLVAETKSGSISVAGGDVADCNVIATICVRAATEQQAQEIAEQVEIQLERADKTLTVKAREPAEKSKCAISISYNITVPRQTNIECASLYGAIKIANISGNATGKTGSGSITAENVEGSAQLNTSYGSIACKDVSGENIRLKSGSGKITAENIKGSAQIDTNYGSITCKDFSGGNIRLKSSSGEIKLLKASFGDCDVRTSYGSIVSDEVTGKLVKLGSGSGNITATKSSATTTNVSASYGSITCREIISDELTAETKSGNIDITCSESAPAGIAANVVTSYGSINFVAPPNFSGQVEVVTNYGSIRNELVMTTTTEVSKKKVMGAVGAGKGMLRLQTAGGSIKIK